MGLFVATSGGKNIQQAQNPKSGFSKSIKKAPTLESKKFKPFPAGIAVAKTMKHEEKIRHSRGQPLLWQELDYQQAS